MGPSIETLAIGDELLTGQVIDSNSSFVGDELFKMGFQLSRQNVIPDNRVVIQSTLKEIASRAKAVICFGGLGPTTDDITASSVAEILGVELERDVPSHEKMLGFLEARKRLITEQVLKQVLVPHGTQVISNPVGLAPGFSFAWQGCRFFFLPGVPSEMKAMAHQFVLPEIKKLFSQEARVESLVWRCIGIVESELQRLMLPIEEKLPASVRFGYRTSFPENTLIVYVQEKDEIERKKLLKSLEDQIDPMLRAFSYSREEKDLDSCVFEILKNQRKRIVLVESCTGGLITQRLTRISGASDWIWGGLVTYQVNAKEKLLGVQLESEEQAVSQVCSSELAQAALKKSGCDLALAITGYMGPTGGTETDPIGTFYLAIADNKGQVFEERKNLPKRERYALQWGSSSFALNAIRKFLK